MMIDDQRSVVEDSLRWQCSTCPPPPGRAGPCPGCRPGPGPWPAPAGKSSCSVPYEKIRIRIQRIRIPNMDPNPGT